MGDVVATRTEIMSDAFQQSADAMSARAILATASLPMLRALCDLNYLDTEGGRKTLAERLIADRHN